MIAPAGTITQHDWPARRVPGVSPALCLAAFFVFLSSTVTHLFQYDRDAILAGEYWRVLTCQWAHWNLSHMTWDALMLLILGVLCERMCRTTFVACIAVSAVLIPVAIGIALPEMRYYRGLSGLDSALFVLLAVQLIRMYGSSDRPLAATAAIGLGAFILKTVYESVSGSIIFVEPESTFTAVPLAHIVGGGIGLVIAALGERRRALRVSSCDSTPG